MDVHSQHTVVCIFQILHIQVYLAGLCESGQHPARTEPAGHRGSASWRWRWRLAVRLRETQRIGCHDAKGRTAFSAASNRRTNKSTPKKKKKVPTSRKATCKVRRKVIPRRPLTVRPDSKAEAAAGGGAASQRARVITSHDGNYV